MFTTDNVFFIADTHFGHRNILKLTDRPFENTKEMDEAIIELWNERVGPEDHIFHLGDVSWHNTRRTLRILERLQGHIHLIRGNHDTYIAQGRCAERFASIHDLYELTIPDPELPQPQRIVLCHYALRVWNHSAYGAWHLYGHSHGLLPDVPASLSFDIGMDCYPDSPLSYPQIKALMHARRPQTPTHQAQAIL